MDQRKALFRAKLREAQKQEKRNDSPLVRYNENDQPVCKVCNVTVKSESLWQAHQVSRKHREAIENLKATATGLTRENNVDDKQQKETQKLRTSSTLPSDFFNKQGTKRQRNDGIVGGKSQPVGSLVQERKNISTSISQPLDASESMKKGSEKIDVNQLDTEERSESTNLGQPSKRMDHANAKQTLGALPENFFDNNERTEDQPVRLAPGVENSSEVKQLKKNPPDGFFDSIESRHSIQLTQGARTEKSNFSHAKGALPEGFFDNKDKDLRARGIEPVKVDINDAYKEFEKEIQVNLQVVDDRLEEEEIDAADEMEEYRSLEQKEYKEKVEEVKKKLLEAKAERLARAQRHPALMGKESSDESSSDEGDDDDDGNFTVDWRAQHL